MKERPEDHKLEEYNENDLSYLGYLSEEEILKMTPEELSELADLVAMIDRKLLGS
ncbi:MAG: hypothetical protein KatS3mg101_1067 [Patescibacteria group bacterium]|nr:MAG: hypothetical protein KatS3mg101_1067 [Patescibacteria group bacterium]